MWRVILLFILSLLFYFWLKKLLDQSLLEPKKEYARSELDSVRLAEESNQLREDNISLGNSLQQTIALYDITKEMCKTLDTDRVLRVFKEKVNRYTRVDDCKFLKPDTDLSSYSDYISLPLAIHRSPIGFLVVRGLKEEDRDKFNILAQQFLLAMKRALLYQKIQELAITDNLTKVASRRYCLERLNEELARSKKMKYHFALVLVDIDHFKAINDHYGHLVGDAVLKHIAKIIKENIRQIDLIGRYGGEEFLVILTETDKGPAYLAAERIREAVENKRIRAYDDELRATISLGVSVFPSDASDAETLLDKADRALYKAKGSGRNRTCNYEE